MTKGIITKTGNSYAIRVPKKYIDDNDLKLGDTVEVEDPLEKQRTAVKALMEYGKKHGPVPGIPDPVAWQKQIRSEWHDPWKEIEEPAAEPADATGQ